MNFAAFERAQLAAFAYREARRSGSLDCMRAVCFVLRNRVKSAWGESSWLAVMESAAAVAAHELAPDQEPSNNDRLLQLMVRDVDDIYMGQEHFDDRVAQVVCDHNPGGRMGQANWKPALYYSFIDRPFRPWFVENIIQKPAEHAQTGQIGKMMLYR
jgi:hypothetical protein